MFVRVVVGPNRRESARSSGSPDRVLSFIITHPDLSLTRKGIYKAAFDSADLLACDIECSDDDECYGGRRCH